MAEENKVSIKITDVYVIAQAMEVAIKRKTFSEKEVKEIYPAWSSVIRFCEDVKRKTEIEELYNKKENESSTVTEKTAEEKTAEEKIADEKTAEEKTA